MNARHLITAIEGEFSRYKALAEGAMRQVRDDELARHAAAGSADDLARRSAGAEAANSIAVIVQHIAGNLRSRFTDFLTSDGEKPWRDRDREFDDRTSSRAELLAQWEDGWRTVVGALAELSDADLGRTVVIRGQSFRIDEALLRSVAHASYHVGQIVYIAKAFRGAEWQSLSIPERRVRCLQRGADGPASCRARCETGSEGSRVKIALASDHAGFRYKTLVADLLTDLGHEVVDFGTSSEEPVDYPRFIRRAAQAVASGACKRGVVFGGSGNGEAMVANRLRGVRCALCWNVESARLARAHNDANMLSIGQRLLPESDALAIVRTWLNTPYDGGRHAARVAAMD